LGAVDWARLRKLVGLDLPSYERSPIHLNDWPKQLLIWVNRISWTESRRRG
jgi:hypothetical protein